VRVTATYYEISCRGTESLLRGGPQQALQLSKPCGSVPACQNKWARLQCQLLRLTTFKLKRDHRHNRNHYLRISNLRFLCLSLLLRNLSSLTLDLKVSLARLRARRMQMSIPPNLVYRTIPQHLLSRNWSKSHNLHCLKVICLHSHSLLKSRRHL